MSETESAAAAKPDTFDVVIVGGGVSGLYAAWRLASQTNGPPLRVALYEYSDKLGGRMDTHHVPNTGPAQVVTDTRVELGAMRFPPSHEMVRGLLAELKLPTEPFPAQDFVHLYLRGKPLSMPPPPSPNGPPAGLPQVIGVPYQLAGLEASHPHVLLAQALMRILPFPLRIGATGFEQPAAGGKTEPITAADWDSLLAQVQVDGKPLWQWGFWNLLSNVLSKEGYQYLLDAFGVESAVSNWNALLAIRLLVTILGDAMTNRILHPVGGWVELVNVLEQKLSQLPNCTVMKGWRVLSIAHGSDRGPSTPLQLTLWDGKLVNTELGGLMPGLLFPMPQFKTVQARNVILALPARAIELLNLEGLQPGLMQNLIQRMQQVIRIPAFKAYISYMQPWWQQWCGWESGYTVTDLPLRQVFYAIGFPGPAVGAQPPAGSSGTVSSPNAERILMASYADANTVSYWSGLLPPGQRVQEFWGSDKNQDLPLRQAMNRQLKELHGYQSEFPEGLWACTVDWTADPFGAGWHAWRPMVDVISEIPRMRQVISDLAAGQTNVFICGEAFSHIQGWIEGALTSTESLLEEQFHLSRPTWIAADYPLGPAQPASKTSTGR